jgi:ATP-dependent Lhr-like helicase
VLEAYREVLQEYFDLPALREVLGDLRARRIRATTVDGSGPSPFASSLTFDFIASYLYEYDAPPAERRAMALTIDQSLLRELLGEPELRDLLDPEVVASVELELQRLAPDRRVAGADAIADLLRDLGPLPTAGVAARTTEDDPQQILEGLEAERRLIRVSLQGEACWAAVEDAARLRDALGVVPPQGVPQDFLEAVADPLGDVVGRHARTHGPFTTADAAAALGLPPAAVGGVLERLEERGRLTRGAFRPGGEGREWVDVEVLRRLRRRSLAVLRRQVEAVDPQTYARFCAAWHGIGAAGGGTGRLVETLRRLQGAAVPASILEADVLGSRLAYSPDLLDALAASGEVVWIGRGPLGTGDGRVALYLREQVPLLAWDLDLERPDGEIHERLRTHLADRGASFFADLYAAAGGGDPQEVVEALWDLVWAGEVTNDTLAPLRAFLWGKVRRRGTKRPGLPPAATPPSASGRWYLAADLRREAPSPTAAATARAEQLLERHGIVVRDAVLGEGVPGGFAGLYPVFAAMEDAGRVRRGYFVEGLGGSQFAAPGAVDRLRGVDDGGVVTLAAADPANPYGAAVAWPESPGGRPGRNAGAFVVLAAGRLAAYVERGGRRVLTFSADEADLAAAAGSLAELGRTRRLRRPVVGTVDGEPAAATPLGRLLQEAGFVPSYRGLALRDA